MWWSDWEEVPYGTEGGFFEGAVVTEAQLNFTHEKYGSGDIYLLLDFAAGIGIVLISAVVVVDVTLAVMAKLEALAFYVENFGVRQGFEMYKYLGVENLPNGVISWLQADMADGDSSVDDLVEGGSNAILSYEEAEEIAFNSIKGNKNADKVVLGKYDDGGATAYTTVAKELNAQYFELDNWEELAAKYSDDEIWKINQNFLDIQTSSGREIYLSHNPAEYIGDGSFYSREIQYLLEAGYEFIDEGGIWHAVR